VRETPCATVSAVHSGRFRGVAYGGAIAAVAMATAATGALRPLMGPSVSLLFFPAVIAPAVYGGYGPAWLAAALSTFSIAYFFVPPINVFDLGIDDLLRLCVFGAVGSISAWLSARRRRAEDALRRSLLELESHLLTLKRVSGWPMLIGPDVGASVKRMLDHAAGIVGASAAAVTWEAEDEPWVYLAATTDPEGIVKEAVSMLGQWRHAPPHLDIVRRIGDESPASALFESEYVAGRVYFTGVKFSAADLTPTLALVAREVGNSLGQLQLAERVRQLAVHEDRIRVARDLHDGVLQGMTGIRLELQAIADTAGPAGDRLLAIERALGIEQRELRLFIDELKPVPRGPAQSGPIATRLEEMCGRFSAEWKVPVTLRVTPADMTLPQTIEQAVRLMIHEGVSNALKHGHPSGVAVDIETDDARLKVLIVDDGWGFGFHGRIDHDELVRGNAGPVSLRERVIALDGRLSIESRPTGSRVQFVIPVAGHPVDAG
jgi:signal transduction histidine kinase